ncbi:MAG: STAS/SEC14 domain-containing protein [Myxococcales bacterium]|nr:STAS/SEC14 domain-containing protein [Myxococcales bacterium]
MLEKINDLPEDVIGLRVRGKLTKADYDDVMRPTLENARAQGKRIRLLCQLGPEFEGFTAGAALQDASLLLQYIKFLERCAIVSDLDWIGKSMKYFGGLSPTPVKVFGNAEFEQAVEWLDAPEKRATLTHELLEDKGVLVVEPHGALKSEDFDVLSKAIDPWLQSHGALTGIVVRSKEFPGWQNLAGFVQHIRFVGNHHRKIDRVAFCSDGKLAQLAPRLAEHFVKAELKQFPYDANDDAIEWAGKANG